ncbi:Proton-translocating NADH-quinone oxidoreductase subunit M [Planctomycetales bacterium 10988]|nr:Proton-translocating NADH-quinone oxidoreductase subunit M [Planctomycetales bacterium 10988]
MSSAALLSSILFFPCLGALVILFWARISPAMCQKVSLVCSGLVALATFSFLLPGLPWSFAPYEATVQHGFALDWIPSFQIYYYLGLDGISFPLVVLTAGVSFLAIAASGTIKKHAVSYYILILLLITGMLGVFLSLDLFLFYIFWEVVLLPMYFLIGIWGGPRKEYAAIKFFLYTIFGSILMLIALLMLYFASDLTDPRLEEFVKSDTIIQQTVGSQALEGIEARQADDAVQPLHTFNILALQKIGQLTDQFDEPLLWGYSLQWWAFLLLFIGFAIKLPLVPVHTWLPDAHVEAPTPISMILAGVLLKMGGYGLIRICYPICPEAAQWFAYPVAILGVIAMLYGAFAALAQWDFKRLVAYSSVSHMGYVVLGLAVCSVYAGGQVDSQAWAMGMNGAMFQMIAHGISSAGMFFCVGMLYDRVKHRQLDQFGGLFHRMPTFSGLSFGIFFASMGLPGLCGFIGEIFVLLSTWKFSAVLAIVGSLTLLLTAGYILWTLQRVYLGFEYHGPLPEKLSPATKGEISILGVLLAFAILLGIYPQSLFRYMEATVTQTADALAERLSAKEEPDEQQAQLRIDPLEAPADTKTLLVERVQP